MKNLLSRKATTYLLFVIPFCVFSKSTNIASTNLAIAGQYFLIDADTDERLFELTENSTVNLNQYGQMLNIEAVYSGAVGSVHFETTGHTRTESAAPYAMYGDSSGDFFGHQPSVGSIEVTIKYYSGAGGGGSLLDTDIITINYVESSVSYLVNADTDARILGLQPTNVLQVSDYPFPINIEAVPVNPVGSVLFELPGYSWVENIAPYALYGDTSGDFDGNIQSEGFLPLKITYYSGPDATGSIIDTEEIDITFVNQTYGTYYLINADSDQRIHELNSYNALNLDDYPFPVSIEAVPANPTGSVKFTLPDNSARTEGVAPYALYGDVSGDFDGQVLLEGEFEYNVEYISGGITEHEDVITLLIIDESSGIIVNTKKLPNAEFEIVYEGTVYPNLFSGTSQSEFFVDLGPESGTQKIVEINVAGTNNFSAQNFRILKNVEDLSVEVFENGLWRSLAPEFYQLNEDTISFFGVGQGNDPLFSTNLVNGIEYDNSGPLILTFDSRIPITGSTLEITGPNGFLANINPDTANNNFTWDGSQANNGIYQFRLEIQGKNFNGQFLIL